jgi:hypothetical protein
MYSFHRIKAAAATLTVGFLLAVAFAATAQAGGTPQGLTAQQWKAMEARAQAMNRYYGLGRYSPANVALQAEKARAKATNQFYHLVRSTPVAGSRAADERRAQAVNRFYHLGSYAVIESSSSFQWPDAGIGAGAMLGTILVAGGLAIALRRRGGNKPSVPHST